MSTDVAIVGAGIIGCAIARVLAREGVRTIVVDRDEPGRHASWAAAGMLAPQAESDTADELLPLLLESRRLYQDLVPELAEEVGYALDYSTEGLLQVALTTAEEKDLSQRREWQMAAGLRVEELSAQDAQRLEPELTPAVRSCLFFPDDHRIDNRLLTGALWKSAARSGARFEIGRPVVGIEREGGGGIVRIKNGTSIEADTIVIAAGSWSGMLEGLPRKLPVEPVHGQLLSIQAEPTLLRRTIVSSKAYLVPRADGRVIAGASLERIGFHTRLTPRAIAAITAGAIELVPTLADRPITEQWSGLRPGTPDGFPILGPDPDVPSIIYATGHFRNGILLAPVTADVVASLVLGRDQPLELHPFRPDRFTES